MAAGQTIITYGGATLYRCHTVDWRQEPVRDDFSGTDLMYHRFSIKVTGYIHGFTAWSQLQQPLNPLAGQVSSAAQNLIGMRVQMLPRQTFAMRVGCLVAGTTAQNSTGGYLVMYAEPFPNPAPAGITHLDVDNGPKCTGFRITRLVADNVFQVEAEFEVCKVECYAGVEVQPSTSSLSSGSSGTPAVAGSALGNTKGILYHRWTVSDGIDVNLKTTRTYRGRLRTASNNISANDLRYFVVPPLNPGMRRDEIQFSVSPDGMNLDYQIKDTEVIVSAPYPLKRWSIQHSETTSQSSTLTVSCSIDITMTADRNADKADMITIGMNVVWAKLIASQDNLAGKVLLDSLSVTDHIGDEQMITISARGRRLPKKALNAAGDDPWQPWFIANKLIGQKLTAAMVYRNMVPTRDNNWDGTRSFGGLVETHDGDHPYYQGPVKLIGAILPYLQTPCGDSHEISPYGTSLPSDGNSSPNNAPVASVEALVDPDWDESELTLMATEEIENIYTRWVMESVYDEREMKVAMPVANDSSSPGQEATAVVSLAPAQARRIVRIEGERLGEWPQMPSGAQLEGILGQGSGSSSLSSGYVALSQTFLRKKTRYAAPFYTAGGQKLYRIGVDYYFSLNRRPEPSEAVAVGRSIWTTDGDISTNITATMGWV